ncbi:MAG: hypothetical protein GXX10_02815 [Clostridiaceae bacterium]|nr:hypothetical protein [Clostridiaceae bacterium]
MAKKVSKKDRKKLLTICMDGVMIIKLSPLTSRMSLIGGAGKKMDIEN